jgi:hypothetical protein
MSQELADRLAVAAGWVKDGGVWTWPIPNNPPLVHCRAVMPSYEHPFPVGRIDPILDLMREMGEAVDFIHNWTHTWRVATVVRNGRDVRTEGPDLWTALASAVLAAMEKHNGK